MAHEDLGADTAKIFIGNYPRLIDNPITLPAEKAVLERLQTSISGKRVLLYCPTFREKKQADSQYYDPIDIKGFRKFLEDNDLLWIEKRHFSSTFEVEAHKSEAIYYINSDFDINLLYDYIDVLITDYSSASSDCIYKEIKVISFIPDKNEYEHDERGFICEYSKYYPGDLTVSIDELEKAIQRCFSKEYYDTQTISKYKNCRSFLYGDHPEGIEWTMEELIVLPADFGAEPDARIDIEVRELDEVLEVSQQVIDFCLRRGIDQRRSTLAGLSMEEMAGNVVEHGFTKDKKNHAIDIRVVHKDDDVVLRIRDNCVEFNPLDRMKVVNSDDPAANIGIRMVTGFAKNVWYQNLLGQNVLTIRI